MTIPKNEEQNPAESAEPKDQKPRLISEEELKKIFGKNGVLTSQDMMRIQTPHSVSVTGPITMPPSNEKGSKNEDK